MLIIKKPNKKIFKEVAKQLKHGAVVVYPTDTAYALGCDATNAKAVARIFKLKGRDKSKALPMIVADMEMAKKFFFLSFPRKRESNHNLVNTPPNKDWTPDFSGVTKIISLAKKHWPGPLSLVLKVKKGIAKSALSKGTAAVRVPDSTIARTLSKYLGRPIVATSANISYRPTCYSVRAVLRQFLSPSPCAGEVELSSTIAKRGEGRPAPRSFSGVGVRGGGVYVIDAGALPRRRPSTIVKIDESGRIEILRKGSVKL